MVKAKAILVSRPQFRTKLDNKLFSCPSLTPRSDRVVLVLGLPVPKQGSEENPDMRFFIERELLWKDLETLEGLGVEVCLDDPVTAPCYVNCGLAKVVAGKEEEWKAAQLESVRYFRDQYKLFDAGYVMAALDAALLLVPSFILTAFLSHEWKLLDEATAIAAIAARDAIAAGLDPPAPPPPSPIPAYAVAGGVGLGAAIVYSWCAAWRRKRTADFMDSDKLADLRVKLHGLLEMDPECRRPQADVITAWYARLESETSHARKVEAALKAAFSVEETAKASETGEAAGEARAGSNAGSKPGSSSKAGGVD